MGAGIRMWMLARIRGRALENVLARIEGMQIAGLMSAAAAAGEIGAGSGFWFLVSVIGCWMGGLLRAAFFFGA